MSDAFWEIPTVDQVSKSAAERMGSNEFVVGQVWRARSGRDYEVVKIDQPNCFLPGMRVRNITSGSVRTLCLDGREAITGWGSQGDLLSEVKRAVGVPDEAASRANLAEMKETP